jgi:hypothetical protein
MKRSTLQQHKEGTMLCEESMNAIEARSTFLVPQTTKHATTTKTYNNIGKINKHCTNYGMVNHNVETCRKKKEQTMVATIKVAQPSQKDLFICMPHLRVEWT